MVGDTDCGSRTDKANRPQSAQNSAGIQTLLDVRSRTNMNEYILEVDLFLVRKRSSEDCTERYGLSCVNEIDIYV